MSVKAIGHVWDLDLPANKRLVLLAYTDHADHDGNSMWPSVALIAWKTGYSERSVKRITKELVEDDKILIEDGRGKHGVKRYRLDWDAGVKKEPLESANLTPKADATQQSAKVSPKANDKRSDILTPKGDQAQESAILTPKAMEKQSAILSKQSDIAMSPKPSLEPSIKDPAPVGATDADEKSKPKKRRMPDPIFDAVKELVFGIEGDAEGGRIGKIANWLKRKYQGPSGRTVGYISEPAKPEHVVLFVTWYKHQHDADLPRDFEKFVEHWREWGTSVKNGKSPNGYRTMSPAQPPPPDHQKATPEQIAAIEARARQLRQGVAS